MDICKKDVYSFPISNKISVIYGPLYSFPYKVELKHESWKNVKPLIDSNIKFSLERSLCYSKKEYILYTKTSIKIWYVKGKGNIKNNKGIY